MLCTSAGMAWPWTLTFWPKNVIKSSVSQDAPVTKVWQKSINRYWRYRGNIKLPRESRTDGRTDGCTHGQTAAWMDDPKTYSLRRCLPAARVKKWITCYPVEGDNFHQIRCWSNNPLSRCFYCQYVTLYCDLSNWPFDLERLLWIFCHVF